jgi:thymidylate synthase ThyX
MSLLTELRKIADREFYKYLVPNGTKTHAGVRLPRINLARLTLPHNPVNSMTPEL